jgi:hypothetical protein
MRLAHMGGTPISQSLAENIQFNSNTTLLDFDILLWSPNFIIYEYFSNAASMKYQNGGLIVEEQTLNKIKRDVSRRDREMNIMLDNGKNLSIYTPYPIFIYDPNAQVINLLDNFTVLRVKTSSSSGKRVEFRGDEIFAPFWEKNKNILEYQTVFDEVVGNPLFYIQGRQFVVGSYIKVKNGHISFLPAVRT